MGKKLSDDLLLRKRAPKVPKKEQAAKKALPKVSLLKKAFVPRAIQAPIPLKTKVIILTRVSEYRGLVGEVIEINPRTANDCHKVRFTKKMLESADRPERVLGASFDVWFTRHELEEAKKITKTK